MPASGDDLEAELAPLLADVDDIDAQARANRACLSVARKLLKRSYHTLRELGEEALQPA